ncbi:MAG: SH3 domain-containing protein, partial [Spirochaetaceae bacterium]|nr:SH3 domain-containing protein [Spirochaetaceae bacterium]
MILWTAPEGPLPAGSVVPVYIRSNINKVYVVGSLDGKKKLELPLWQVELFPSKRKAAARVAEFGDSASLYLVASRDGLPVREKPSNGARRVYRLHEGQSVKALAKVEGEAVTSGGEPLPGDWFHVLTEDGSRGYVFSNTMRLFDEAKESAAAPALASAANSPARVDLVFSRSWRPELFQEMIDDGRVDVDLFSPRFGLFTDAVRRQIRLELPTVSKVFNYSSIAEESGALLFEGTPLRIRFDGERRLVADWSGRSGDETALGAGQPAAAPAAGSPGAAGSQPAKPGSIVEAAEAEAPAPGVEGKATFVVLSKELRDVIRDEDLRRQKLLEAFLGFGEEWLLKPAAGSAALGGTAAEGAVPQSRLVLSRSRRFSWTGLSALPPGYLPDSLLAAPAAAAPADPAAAGSGAPAAQPAPAAATGEAAFRLYLAPSLAASWDGAISFRFDQGEGKWTDFAYRLRDGGL